MENGTRVNGSVNGKHEGLEKEDIICEDETSSSNLAEFSIPELIAMKRDGQPLSGEQIKSFIDGVVSQEVQDSQLGAMLMSIFLRGMEEQETVDLTQAMKESGQVLEWPAEWRHLMVDKHSTGGVGDKVSLPLAPALAAHGLKVPMISGRGLGHTGGTLDKLESIPGFTVLQSSQWMLDTLGSVGCCIVGQTADLVPADRIMYGVRDVTGTVASVPLMAASIISKKAAESLNALVLDVKVGKGAMIRDHKDAQHLAQTLVNVSNGVGVNTTAVLSSMDAPLGRMVGNALEVVEAVQCLHGKGPQDLRTLVTVLGGHLLYSADLAKSPAEGAHKIMQVLDNGAALGKFCDMLQAQGVEPTVAHKLCGGGEDAFSVLPEAKHKTQLKATATGYVENIDSYTCATVCSRQGAGRTKAGQPIDHAVGLELLVGVGDKVQAGSPWMTVHHNKKLQQDAINKLQGALETSPEPAGNNNNLILGMIHD